MTEIPVKAHRSIKIDLHGILLFDKPTGMSSNGALQKVKYLLQARKAGHTGSLDPLASGLLPLCFGKATKFSQYLLDADKSYQVGIQLGVRTNTRDALGEILVQRKVPSLALAELDHILDQFRGSIMQVPPMYSALKYQGRPLYKLARQGVEVERKARQLMIYSLQILHFTGDEIELLLHCSKGTYVRSLVDDLGEILGCGAHVVQLRRLSVGPYQTPAMVSMATLETDPARVKDQYLLPIETVVSHWPAISIREDAIFYLSQGVPVTMTSSTGVGRVRLIRQDGSFLGAGELLPDGKLVGLQLLR